MNATQRPVSDDLEPRLLRRYVRPYALALAAMWLLIVLYLLFGVTGSRATIMTVLLTVGLGLTAWAAIYGAVNVRRGLRLARSGQEVVAEVVRITGQDPFGRSQLLCRFDRDGQAARANVRLRPLDARGLGQGSLIRLVVDPSDPRVCLPSCDLWTNVAPAPESMRPHLAERAKARRRPEDCRFDYAGLGRQASTPGAAQPAAADQAGHCRRPVRSGYVSSPIGRPAAPPPIPMPNAAETTKLPSMFDDLHGQDKQVKMNKVWLGIVLGILFCLFSIHQFYRLSEWEESGGIMGMHSTEWFLYDHLGKWGVIGIGLPTGLIVVAYCTYRNITSKGKSKSAP